MNLLSNTQTTSVGSPDDSSQTLSANEMINLSSFISCDFSLASVWQNKTNQIKAFEISKFCADQIWRFLSDLCADSRLRRILMNRSTQGGRQFWSGIYSAL